MRLVFILCCTALLHMVPVVHAADGQKAGSRADSSASQAGGPVSPTVRAAENAEVPGDLRPEKRAVPQISIPLKGRTSKGAASGAGNRVDDEAARCLAMKSKRERAECQRVGVLRRPVPAKQ